MSDTEQTGPGGTDPAAAELRDAVVGVLRSEGCAAVGVCGVEPLDAAREAIERRRTEGLDGGMQFTYRNPARSTDPRRTLPSARAAVVAALPYRSEVDPAPPEPSAAVARYAAADTYAELRAALAVGREVLRSAGYRGVVLADDNALVDRAMARRAGLGWLGRNTNLLVPGVGSWVVLGTVLTDAPLPLDGGAATGEQGTGEQGTGEQGTGIEGCGTCRRCLDGCPTGALVAPGVLDGSRCLSWLLQRRGSFPQELRSALGARIYGCDDCQEVCPPNRRAPEVPATTPAGGPGAWVPLVELLESDDEHLMDHFGVWYVADREPRYLRRNALVVLGNVGDGDDPVVERLLVRYLGCGDGLLVEHAGWAAQALGRGDLVTATPVDPVRASLAAPQGSDETGDDGRR